MISSHACSLSGTWTKAEPNESAAPHLTLTSLSWVSLWKSCHACSLSGTWIKVEPIETIAPHRTSLSLSWVSLWRSCQTCSLSGTRAKAKPNELAALLRTPLSLSWVRGGWAPRFEVYLRSMWPIQSERKAVVVLVVLVSQLAEDLLAIKEVLEDLDLPHLEQMSTPYEVVLDWC